MLSADLVSKAAFPSFSAGGATLSVLSANGRYVAFVDSESLTGLSTTQGVQNIYRFDRATGEVMLVSINSAGTGGGNGASDNPVISADGNVVAFSSTASNLHPLDTNSTSDIFARNLITGTTYLVSVNSAGTGSGNGASDSPVISADGNVVAFRSSASNLHPLDTNSIADIFARNLTTGTTSLVSINSAGTGGGIGSTDRPVISADGNVVAFRSDAQNLSPLKTSGLYHDLFARDLATSTTRLVSMNSAGTSSGNGDSDSAAISADGSVIAFRSDASTLVSSDSNGKSDVFVRNLLTGTTRLVSVNSAGSGSGNGASDSPAISADGDVVAYRSTANDLGALDTNSSYDIYALNLVTGMTDLVSLGLTGVASGATDGPVISADGSVVVFSSNSQNLHPLDTSLYADVFARNLATGTTSLVSVNAAGTASGNLWSEAYGFKLLGISADGSVVSFHSDASDLVTTDFNGTGDLFVRDLLSGSTQLVSTFDVDVPSTTAGNSSTVGRGAMSADGRYVVFVSKAQNLAAGIDIRPDSQNVYRMDRVTGHIDLVSINVDGTGSGNGDSGEPVISADGSVVAFSSDANNLDSSIANGATEIFVRNFTTGTTQLVSVNLAGTGGGDRSSYGPTISADGNVVAFYSRADNLHPLDTNGITDIFARNLATGTTYLVSVSSDGTTSGNGESTEPVISADGRVVAFQSYATNLHPLKTDSNHYDIFARNLETGTTYFVSINAAGNGRLGFTHLLDPVISANGEVVAFRQFEGGVYARNLVTGTNYVVSIDPTGTFAGSGDGEVISADGSVVAFCSSASLSSLDTTGRSDIYVRNIVTGTTYLVSINSTGTANGNGDSSDPSISADGNVIAFRSEASNLNDLKTDSAYFDVFARNLLTGSTYLLSSNADGTGSGNDDASRSSPIVSADGRVVAFSSDASNLVHEDYNSSSDVFAATIPSVPFPLGDYNQNSTVDAADYVLWRKSVGTTGVAPFSGSDGSGNGSVGTEDYDVWRAHFGQTLPPPGDGSGLGGAKASAPPIALVNESTGVATSMSLYVDERSQKVEIPRTSSEKQAADQREGLSPVLVPASLPFAAYRPAVREPVDAQRSLAASRRDEALLAWSASQRTGKKQFVEMDATMWTSQDVISANDVYMDSLEDALAQLSSDQVGFLALHPHDRSIAIT